MLDNLKVQVLSAESFGVRSMATYVETPSIRIVFDAGVALGPRFGLLPHPVEYRALSEARKKLRQSCERADVVVTTHYHFDHFSPAFNSDFTWTWSSKEVTRQLYQDKIVLVKDPKENINYSQQLRAWYFLRFLERVAKEVEVADAQSFQFGDTTLSFSKAVPHGEEGGHLGYVLVASLKYGDEKFVFAPDVQGPMDKNTTSLIIRERPNLLFLGGPPSYLVPGSVTRENLERAIESIMEITAVVKTTIVDHHLMRDANWKEEIEGAFMVAKMTGNTLTSAAEFTGAHIGLLEARRRELYSEMPASKEFLKWTRKKYEERRRELPPI